MMIEERAKMKLDEVLPRNRKRLFLAEVLATSLSLLNSITPHYVNLLRKLSIVDFDGKLLEPKCVTTSAANQLAS